jgi:hypothetical protein
MCVDKEPTNAIKPINVKPTRPKEQITILERMTLVEKVRSLDNDSTTQLVQFLYFLKKDYIEDVNEDKLQIRVDLFNRDTFEKLIK